MSFSKLMADLFFAISQHCFIHNVIVSSILDFNIGY